MDEERSTAGRPQPSGEGSLAVGERLRSAASTEILVGAVMCARVASENELAVFFFFFFVFAFQTAGEDKKLGTAMAISSRWYLKQQPRNNNDDDHKKNVFRVSFKK